MPTKPNSAGQQQNYVPAGHGDASGEYGDNATGSNIHIRFERKDPILEEDKGKASDSAKNEVKSETKQEPKPSTGKTGNSYLEIDNYIKGHSTLTKKENI